MNLRNRLSGGKGGRQTGRLGLTYTHCAVLSHSVISDSLQPHGLQPARPLCLWGFSRQEYQSGLPCPPPWGLPNPEIKPRSPALQEDCLPSVTREAQEYWSGQPIPSPGELPDPGMEPGSPALQADSLPAELPRKPHTHTTIYKIDKKNLLYSTENSTKTL